MFLVVLILLSVAAYFLLHAYRDWQHEQHSGAGYQRATVKGGSATAGSGGSVTAGSSSNKTAKTGTPASGYKSSQSGKQTTQFRETADTKQNDKNKNKKTAASSASSSAASSATSSAKASTKNQSTGNNQSSSSNQGSGNNRGSANNQSASSNQGSGNNRGSAKNQSSSSNQGSGNNRGSAENSANHNQSSSSKQSEASSASSSGAKAQAGSGKSDNNNRAGSRGKSSNNQGSSTQGSTSGTGASSSDKSNKGGQAAAASVAAVGVAAATAGSSSTSQSGQPAPAVTKETLRFSNREAQADDLKKINGIGPAIEKDLNVMGVYNFKQIADFQPSDIDNINTALDFPGRVERDEWIPQAKRLQGQSSGNSTSGSGQRSTSSAATSAGNTARPAVTKESLRFTNRETQADDLKKINGIGPAIEKDMNTMGVYNFKQIANFQQADIDNVNTALDFPGRIERDEWIPQAKRLMGQGTGAQSGSVASQTAAAGSATASNSPTVTKETLRFSNREAQADNLQLISGVGPVIEQDLNSMGIYNFSQIANFQQNDIDNVNTAMDFPGRIERDEWIPQARRLMQSNSGSTSAAQSGNSAGTSSSRSGSSSWSSGTVAGAAVAGSAAVAAGAAHSSGATKRGSALVANASSNSPDDLAGEIRERIKILNLRESDAKRLAVSESEFSELAGGGHANLGSEKLLDVTKILRWLCDEEL